jgi:uncharacterized protein (DUF2267 family)
MTLCVSGIAANQDAVISVFDRQLTLTDNAGSVLASTEEAVKVARINHGWALAFAGEDIRLVGLIMDSVKNELITKRPVSLERARQAVVSVRDRILNQTLSSEVLGRFGMDVETFWREGQQRITDPALYQSVRDRLLTAESGCDFLLAGFGTRARIAHIMAILDRYAGSSFDRLGFGAVGSGDVDAYQVLVALQYSRKFSVAEAAYALCAAKFAAESHLVGRGTHVSIFKRDGSMCVLNAEVVRPLVQQYGVKHMPAGIEALMPPLKQIVAPYRNLRRATKSARKSPTRGRRGRTP